MLPESVMEEEEVIPRISRLCMMENKDDESLKEAKYDSEICILLSSTVSKQLRYTHVNNRFKRHAPDKTLPFYLKWGVSCSRSCSLKN